MCYLLSTDFTRKEGHSLWWWFDFYRKIEINFVRTFYIIRPSQLSYTTATRSCPYGCIITIWQPISCVRYIESKIFMASHFWNVPYYLYVRFAAGHSPFSQPFGSSFEFIIISMVSCRRISEWFHAALWCVYICKINELNCWHCIFKSDDVDCSNSNGNTPIRCIPSAKRANIFVLSHFDTLIGWFHFNVKCIHMWASECVCVYVGGGATVHINTNCLGKDMKQSSPELSQVLLSKLEKRILQHVFRYRIHLLRSTLAWLRWSGHSFHCNFLRWCYFRHSNHMHSCVRFCARGLLMNSGIVYWNLVLSFRLLNGSNLLPWTCLTCRNLYIFKLKLCIWICVYLPLSSLSPLCEESLELELELERLSSSSLSLEPFSGFFVVVVVVELKLLLSRCRFNDVFSFHFAIKNGRKREIFIDRNTDRSQPVLSSTEVREERKGQHH